MKTTRRTFLQTAALIGASSMVVSATGKNLFEKTPGNTPDNSFTLPPLPYAYDAS
jgi:hypothetical protein